MSPPAKSRMDSVLVAATIAFAFLAASFAAANSDLWLHLATGRLIASGGYSFGKDPFSYFTADAYWANHSWLFDIGLYELFQLGGGAALVGAKAVGVALLAGVMLRLSLRGNGPVWLAAGSTLLAILAMSPRLILQPQCLSLLLFAVCLSLVAAGGRAVRWLPLVMVLWVNLDAWFVLGLGTVLIHGIMNRQWRPVLLCFGACLLNPHHVHAFTVPPELSPRVWSNFGSDPRFDSFFTTPWTMAGLASWSFPVLLGSSAASFIVRPRAVRGWWFAVWLPLAVLAAWQARLVPFFAVAAGPFLAINFGATLGPNRGTLVGRRIVLLCALALLVLAWPGWLMSFHARNRALAWRLAPDPSLTRAAERVRDRNIPAVFHTNPDFAHYLAWSAPGVQGGVDGRLPLFARRPDLYWDPEFSVVAVNEVEPGSSIAEVAGSVVIVNRRTAQAGLNPERLAFAPTIPPAPETGALLLPAEWWNLAAHRQAPRTWEGEAAPTYLRLFDMQKGPERSPALPLLAVRSARTSLAVEPRGDDAWVALARGYLLQSRGSWEAAASTEFTLLRYLRHAQVVGALQQALLANPDNAAAHELLAGAFTERRLFDLALHHRREQLRLLKRTGTSAEIPIRIQEMIAMLEADVFDAESRFRVHTDALSGSPLERARIARDLGLGETAVDTLEKSHFDLYGVEGLRVLLDLWLQTGRLTKAREFMDQDEIARNSAMLDRFMLPGGVKNGRTWRYVLPAYAWFDFCQRAAAGQYEKAEAALEKLREYILDAENGALPNVSFVHRRTTLGGLGAVEGLHRMALGLEREYWALNVADTKFLASVRGDLHALGGLLHLERGAVREAEVQFRQALARYAENTGSAAVHPGRPLAVRYREALRTP